MIDRSKFFSAVRQTPFGGSLTQQAVDGMNAILDEWEKRASLTDFRWLAYMLATALGEVGANMTPVREGFKSTDAQARAYVKAKGYPYAKVINGQVYYGRGLVQLTWDYNYKSMGTILGIDLLGKPDLALVPQNAANIMFEGMTRGSFTGKKLSDYISGSKCDYVNARRIINGTDRANEIATYASKFEKALNAAYSSAPTIFPAPQKETPQNVSRLSPSGFWGWVAYLFNALVRGKP